MLIFHSSVRSERNNIPYQIEPQYFVCELLCPRQLQLTLAHDVPQDLKHKLYNVKLIREIRLIV